MGWLRASATAVAVIMVLAAPAHGERERVDVVTSFGIVTDVHYADAAPSGTRIYRDSLPKVKAAMATFNEEQVDFVMSLGDLKDTDADQGCTKPDVPASSLCVNLTVQFLKTIEQGLANFTGARLHVLGNHDVDILTQDEVLGSITDSALPGPGSAGGPGYSSWSLPSNSTNNSPDTLGCLVRDDAATYLWVIHQDGTRNWLSTTSPDWFNAALIVPNISMFPKRHGGLGAYSLNAADSATVFAQRCQPGHCMCNPATGTANATTLPTPIQGTLRFIRLNADFTDHDVPWADLENVNGPGAVPGMSWERANVPSFQLTWLAAELDAAAASGQHVVVFVHYRVDGGPNGPVGTGLGPSSVPSRSWVDDCTLQNAEVVRDILEHHPGLVLAVFSGHDHNPLPPYTKETSASPLYFTHHALVEGALPHNAYSVVDILANCTIVVRGFVDAYNVTIPGPPGHSCVRDPAHR